MQVAAYGEKKKQDIQNAIYLAEMKGEFSVAIKMLENAANEGDEEDKENAYFYLGKLHEAFGNATSANFYYSQSLSRATVASKIYWLAKREGKTSTQAERMLRSTINLKSPIRKIFGSFPTFLLLQDGSISKIESDKLVNVTKELPKDVQVLNIISNGVWYKTLENDSIIFKPFNASSARKSYPITNASNIIDANENILVQKERNFTLINSKENFIDLNDKYNDCSIEGLYAPTTEFILNCSDNALHFISAQNAIENRTIAQFDIIKRIFIDKAFVYLISGNNLYCYIPQKTTYPLWKISVNNVENLFSFENNLALLEASGKILLVNKLNGFIAASAKTDATTIYSLSKGTLGLFSSEGALTVTDTLLNPLWHFNFAKPVDGAPILTDGNIYLNFGNKKLQGIAPHYYGQKYMLSEILTQRAAKQIQDENWEDLPHTLDSLFKLEPGNAEGWFFKALYLERFGKNATETKRAWTEAVRLSQSNAQTTKLILNRYSKTIGAKFVSALPISPKTLYPQFFGYKENLYTIDPADNRLFCIKTETGELRWSKNIGTLGNSPVTDNDENILAIASGYNLTIYDLNHEVETVNLQLPGKIFNIKITTRAIYASTWNGFLLKILRQNNKIAWSRKVFSVPFLFSENMHTIYVCNLEGEFVALDNSSGLAKENSSLKFTGQVTHILSLNSTVILATGTNKLYLFNPTQKTTEPQQILMESSVSSLQKVTNQGKEHILIGLSNQTILLYTENGAPIWKFNGKGAIFPKPFVKNGYAWIDQGNEVVGISLKTGKAELKFSTPGGAGTPFIMNNTLYSASPKRLLYGFSI